MIKWIWQTHNDDTLDHLNYDLIVLFQQEVRKPFKSENIYNSSQHFSLC